MKKFHEVKAEAAARSSKFLVENEDAVLAGQPVAVGRRRRMKRVLIANRGEIAVRIIRAAHELGIETVAVHSQADADSLAVRSPTRRSRSARRRRRSPIWTSSAILEAARASGADAVHPGYGFLAENADFAERSRRPG